MLKNLLANCPVKVSMVPQFRWGYSFVRPLQLIDICCFLAGHSVLFLTKFFHNS
jgi:hypothetical protein